MTEAKLPPADEFDKALAERAADFGVRLGADARARLRAYYELVAAWNKSLHLVAPCTPAEFATRHVLESLLALPFLAEGARVVDVGSGAGLPLIPCLLARPDLTALLVESKQKKAVFLRHALSKLGLRGAADAAPERFEHLRPPAADALTCRAVERFTEILPQLVSWAERVPTLLLFGGESLGEALQRLALPYEAVRMPDSERRFLFVVRR